jgi:hypothetical protein
MGRPSWRPCVKTSRCSPAPTSHTSSFGLRSPRRSEQGASPAPRSPGPGAGWSGCGPRPRRSSWTCRWRSGPETWPRATASVATMRCIWPLCSAWGPRAWCIVWRAGMTICVAPPLMRAMRFSRCRPPCPPLPKVFPPGPKVGLEPIDRGADPVPRLGCSSGPAGGRGRPRCRATSGAGPPRPARSEADSRHRGLCREFCTQSAL